MKSLKKNQKFESVIAKRRVKITKVVTRAGSNKYDTLEIVDIVNGKVVKGTERVVFADSIRRRYSI